MKNKLHVLTNPRFNVNHIMIASSKFERTQL